MKTLIKNGLVIDPMNRVQSRLNLLLADGKSRKVESPKRKKRRHVLFVAADENRLSEKIRGEARITNSELRKTLAAYREEVYPDQEG